MSRFSARTVFLTETFPPGVGGIQHYLSGLLSRMPPAATVVIAPAERGAADWDAGRPYRIVRTRFHGRAYPRWRPALRVLRQVVHEHRPEVVVCGKALFEGRAAHVLARERSLPYVVLTYGMEIRTWLARWKTRRDLLRVLHGAARVVVINDDTKRLLVARGVPGRKMVKIYPGVDDRYFESGERVADARRALGLSAHRVIVSVSRLIPRKGMDVALRAVREVLASVPDARYLIVGEGPERVSLERQAEDLGIGDRVRFLGRVPDETVRRCLRSADVFVLTPREDRKDVEGFGIVYGEAAAAGVCAVGSRTGGVPEAVLDGTTGILVPPEDAHATAGAIVRLLKNDALRARLAHAARERARRDLSWSRRALLFRGMLESVAREET